MKPNGPLRDESGFTIQEMLVAMIVGSILVALSYSLYLFVIGFLHHNLDTRQHVESTQHVLALLSADIERSRFARVSDTSLVVEYPWAKSVVYRTEHGSITRNGLDVSPEDSSRWVVICKADSSADDPKQIEITVKQYWRKDSVVATTRASAPWSSHAAFLEGPKRKKTL